jgi:hypothetical protein
MREGFQRLRLLWMSPRYTAKGGDRFVKPPLHDERFAEVVMRLHEREGVPPMRVIQQRQRWTWYGFDCQRRKVVAFVNERRTDAAWPKFLQKLGAAGSRVITRIIGSLTPSFYRLGDTGSAKKVRAGLSVTI